jgi:hypothetical protein
MASGNPLSVFSTSNMHSLVNSPSHPWTWKGGFHKVRDYLTLTTSSTKRWCWPWTRNKHLLLRNNHFLLQVHFQGKTMRTSPPSNPSVSFNGRLSEPRSVLPWIETMRNKWPNNKVIIWNGIWSDRSLFRTSCKNADERNKLHNRQLALSR